MILFYSYKDSFDESFNFYLSKKDRIKYNLKSNWNIYYYQEKKIYWQFINLMDLEAKIIPFYRHFFELSTKKLDEKNNIILYNFKKMSNI